VSRVKVTVLTEGSRSWSDRALKQEGLKRQSWLYRTADVRTAAQLSIYSYLLAIVAK